jgi:hypothetical protein
MKKPFKTYNGGKAGNGTYQQIINPLAPVLTISESLTNTGASSEKVLLAMETFLIDKTI